MCNSIKAKAILFDLDGTLIDSVPDINHASNILLKEHGLPSLSVDETRSMIGNGVKVLVDKSFKHLGSPLSKDALENVTNQMMAIYSKNLTSLTVTFDGAEELLKQLKAEQIKIAVVTNKPEGFSRTIINHFGWENLVDAVIGGDTCATRKPEPDMLFTACEKMGAPCDRTIMVGDSPADISAAINAKIPSVAVRGGYTNIPVEDLGANIVVDSLNDVHQALVKLSEQIS